VNECDAGAHARANRFGLAMCLAGRLPSEHRDPFDRMLIAQAQAEDLKIISTDRIFDDYHVQRIW